jgi:hypothetical protein|nr:MAG TPA: hypothetical protein [Caudoviricetes sp.]
MDTALSDLSYEMNMEFMEFIEDIYKENTVKIVDIFQAFTALNEHYINHDKFYVDKLEQRCLDLISTSTSNDDAKNNIEIYIKRSIDHYLGLYGITLNNSELDIFEYSDFLNALVYLYNVDIPTAEELLYTIENDNDNIERFVTMISQFTTVGESYVYDYINEISDDWFGHLYVFYKAKIHRGLEDINNQDVLKVQPLVDVTSNFMTTYSVKDVLYFGYEPYYLDSYLDTLYANLDRYLNDFDSIALEIVAANYLSSDRPITGEETLLDIINFKGLKNIEYHQAMNYVVPRILDYLALIKG